MSDIKIKRALIAVYDKTGIADFARALVDEFGIEIISTGGTAKHLKDAGIPVTMVEQVTGFPEMLDGRVKTLHPMIHAAILADRNNPEHMRQLAEHKIQPIDMVVVNLYPFEKTVADPNCTFEQAIEMIDIGGPCMLRAAAKNHRHVLVVCGDPCFYFNTLHALRHWQDPIDRNDALNTGGLLAFLDTARYDIQVATWLGEKEGDSSSRSRFVEVYQKDSLRYGENPHQRAEVLQTVPIRESGLIDSEIEEPPSRMSFNNYVDGDAALSLVKELTRANLAAAGNAPAADKEPRASARAGRATGEDAATSGKKLPASARESSDAEGPAAIEDSPFAPPDTRAPGWLLTWTTYGQWLPGDPRGFVSRIGDPPEGHEIHNTPGTPIDKDDPFLQAAAKKRMEGEPVRLTSEMAQAAYASFLGTAREHGIGLIAVAIMANHVHIVCQSERDGSALLQLFKGASARRLGQSFPTDAPQHWWTKSGSKRHIKPGQDYAAVTDYVIQQEHVLVGGWYGDAGNLGGGRKTSRAEAGGLLRAKEAAAPVAHPARAEARGSLPEADASPLSGMLSTGHHAVAFIKHTNACGCAIGDDPMDVYRRAYLGDPIAAAGGVLCMNFPVTRELAEVVMTTYSRWGKEAGAAFFKLDVWIAPEFDDDAVQLITTPTEKRKWGASCRLLAVGDMSAPPDPNEMDYKKITGGMLVQSRDLLGLNEDQWKVVTKRAPSESEMSDLRFAWLVCKHTKSNAITICRDGALLGSGAGQMSRVKSCDLAIQLSRENGHGDRLAGAVAAGDAFFPVPDGPGKLIDAGITAIIHPGGSNRDQETIDLADKHNVAMIITGTRHFKH